MRILALAALALLIPQESKAAKARFRSMEEKLLKAKTLKIAYAVVPAAGQATYKGEIYLGEENRCRFVLETNYLKSTIRTLITSDGATVEIVTDGIPGNPFKPPPTMGANLRTRLARAGAFAAHEAARFETSAKQDPAESLPVEGFKLGAKEKVGEREAQVLEFRIPGRVDTFVTVWIDIETQLPLKSTAKLNQGVTQITYETFLADEVLDPNLFKAPPKKQP